MQPQNAALLSGRLVGIIWGDSKAGKTTWACSLPGRKLLINFDPEGFSSIAYRDDVDIIDLSTLPASEAITQAKKVAVYILEHAETYESVIVDSLTMLTEIALYDAVNRRIGKSNTFTPSIDAPGLAAYGARNNTTVEIISMILRATGQKKHNCFFIAHADDPEYDKDGKSIVQQTIMLSAKIRNKAAIKVSEIYYLSVGAGSARTVYLAPFGVRKPMGSRVFDTKKFPKFALSYDIDKADEVQNCSLQSVVKAWRAGKFAKLTALPKL